MVFTLTEEKIDIDVLVVGAGAGGMMAAISAAERGVKVTLCEKGNARRSGGITGGNDHFTCYIPEIHGPKLKEAFVREDLKGLADEDIVRKYIDLSYEMLKKWESWGINMKTKGHYEFTGHGWPGSTGRKGEPGKTSRRWLHFSDDEMCPKLEKQVRETGVQILNRVMVTQLLQDDSHRVVGAIGVSTKEPKLLVFSAKSVVLNTGTVNAFRLYPPPHLIGHGMAHPATGDGVLIAYKAGADIQNAEFCTRQISLRYGPYPGKGTWIGVLRDTKGNPIAPPYLEEPDLEIGDPAVSNPDAFYHVWEMGRGPVWMDPRGISEEEEEYMRWGFKSEALHALLNWIDREGIDIRKTRFEFTVMQPRTHIQARVNANFETTVSGLYAVLSAGLSRSTVGGWVAGENASKYAKKAAPHDIESKRDEIIEAKGFYEELLNRQGSEYADWREAQWAILQIMHCYSLPSNRTENTLKAGYNQLKRLKEKAHRILKAGNQHELYHCLEVLNLMDIAELVLLAIKERRESRGLARRQDYPFTNPMLNKFLVITQREGRPTYRWEEPRRLGKEGI